MESKMINSMKQLLMTGFSLLLSLLYSTTSAAGITSGITQLVARKGGVVVDRLDIDWELMLGGFFVVLIAIFIAARWKASRDAEALYRTLQKKSAIKS